MALSSGLYHTCAVRQSGSLWCWGGNDYGQIGNDTVGDWNTPQQVSTLTDVTQVSAGTFHTCAITKPGDVWCWGSGEWGSIGQDNRDGSLVPLKVSLPMAATSVTVGYMHTCAALEDGSGYCWGDNDSGQLGNGTRVDSLLPTRIVGLDNIAQISASPFNHHTCAVTLDERGYCWGDGQFGVLGAGDISGSNTPTPIHILTSVSAISARGDFHTCAMTSKGEHGCWGYHWHGQIGTGMPAERTRYYNVPMKTLGDFRNLKAIEAGVHHSCAIDAHSELHCWGSNQFGQFGDGTLDWTTRPVPAKLPFKVKLITLGKEHSCAVSLAGKLYCWGGGRFGQLGNGNNDKTTTRPVEVLLP